jgi:hypothetical protein
LALDPTDGLWIAATGAFGGDDTVTVAPLAVALDWKNPSFTNVVTVGVPLPQVKLASKE